MRFISEEPLSIDKWLDGWTDGSTDGRTNEQKDNMMDGWFEELTDKRTAREDGCKKGQTNGWSEGQIGLMYGMNRRTDRQTH